MKPQSLSELSAWIAQDPVLAQVHAFVAQRFGGPGHDPGHDLSHFMRVAFWTLKLAEEIPQAPQNSINAREIVAAALLHDIVPIAKDSPLRKEASRLCAEEAARVLPAMGFSKAAVENIADAIRCHSFSRGEAAKTPLAQALQDADRLEALGTIGIMRCISTGARMGAEYFEGADPWASSRALDDRAYSVDHFFTKLLKLHASMNTKAGRREARKRTRIMQDFLRCLGEELAQPVPPARIEIT
jgi:uncharacterized protein